MNHKFKNNLAIATLATLLISCSWMREAKLPNPQIPNTLPSAESNINYTESLPYLAWWQQFNDPILDKLIESTLNNNLQLQSAIEKLNQARGQLTQVELSWIPNISPYAGYSTNPALGNVGSFFGVWPAYFLNIANTIEQQRYANYQVEELKSMTDGVRLTLIGQTTASYFTLIAQKKQLQLLENLNKDIDEVVKLITQQQQIGLDSDINVTNIKSSQAKIIAQIAVIQHNLQVSNNALKYLIDENPGNISNTMSFDKYNFSQIKPNNLPATILANRPDIIMAQYSVQRSHAGVGVAYSNLFPSIQLDKFFGFGANGSANFPRDNLSLTDAYINWGINPSTFGQIEAQKGAYYSEIYQYIQTVRKALRDTDNSLSANNKMTEQYYQLLNALDLYQQKFDLQQGLYKSGLISYFELMQNKIELDNLRLTVNQAKLEQALALVNLYQELAGGYKFKYASESQIKSTKYIN